jgi:hypothetical protein
MKTSTDGYTHFRKLEVIGDVAEAGNGLQLNAGASSAASEIAAIGDDTNVSLKLTPKATAQVVVATNVCPKLAATTDSTAGALTYTAAMLLGGIILRDPNGAGRSDVTPTAALLLAAIPGAIVGTAFEFTIRNTADAAETITVTAGTGATLSGTMTIAQNNSKRFLVVFTNVTAASEAYTVYSLGTVVH